LHSVLAVCSDLPTGDYDRWRVDGVPEFHLEELLLNTPGCFTKCLRSWNESVGEWDLNLVSLELDKEFFRATGRMLDECLSEQRTPTPRVGSLSSKVFGWARKVDDANAIAARLGANIKSVRIYLKRYRHMLVNGNTPRVYE